MPPPVVFRSVKHFPLVISRWRSSFTERENRTRPFSFSEVGATIRFIVRQQQIRVTTFRNTINGNPLQRFVDHHRSVPLVEKIFPVDVPILLRAQFSMGHVHHMLAELKIPPSTIERLKIEIYMFAKFWALTCQKRNAEFLDLVIEIDAPRVEFHNVVAVIDEELQARLMGVDLDGGFSLVPASRSSIEKLEIKVFDNTEDQELPTTTTTATDTCMICMDEYVRGVEIAQLPCSHFFHRECIFKWLEHKNTCPFCRFAMPTET